MTDKLGVIIVAAGRGSRMRTAESKQYLTLDDKPIIVHTMERFARHAAVGEIVLVTGTDDIGRCQGYVQTYAIPKIKQILAGGSERQHSVYQGLLALAGSVEWVMVHDGVRPFVSEAQIDDCHRRAQETGAAVLAVPVKDTIKVVDREGVIRSTPDRSSLWAIQTPQAFRFSLLREAHDRARAESFVGTDDAMLVERLDATVSVVEGDYYNIKITTPEDLPWAEWILRNARGEKTT